jgi:hypothetical protein
MLFNLEEIYRKIIFLVISQKIYEYEYEEKNF